MEAGQDLPGLFVNLLLTLDCVLTSDCRLKSIGSTNQFTPGMYKTGKSAVFCHISRVQ